VAKFASPDPVGFGSNLTYTLVVVNKGPDTAHQVQVSDPLPAGIVPNLYYATAGQCSWTGGAVVCDIPALSSGEVTVVTIEGSVSGLGVLTNAAAAAAAEDDPYPQDNHDTVSTSVRTDSLEAADVAISKTGLPSQLLFNSNLTYRIGITNYGPGIAAGVVVTDAVPASVAFDAAASSPGWVTTNGVLTYWLGDVPLDGGTSLVVAVSIQVPMTGVITNLAYVATSSLDTNLINNVAAATNGIPDTDVDGSPDYVDDDDDGDGMTDDSEGIAGTDARDAASVLRLRVRPGLDDLTRLLSFPAVSNRVYGVEVSTTLQQKVWVPSGALMDGTNGTIEVVRSNLADRVYFRLNVRPAP
jgi:uncharacterized repeat protein (TIGR01451 family)